MKTKSATLLKDNKGIKSKIHEYGAKDGLNFSDRVKKVYVYTLSYGINSPGSKSGVAVVGPCFIEINGKMQYLNMDLPKDQYLSMINNLNVPEEDKQTLDKFYFEFSNWRKIFMDMIELT